LIMQYGNLVIELKDGNGETFETTIIEEILHQFEENELSLENPVYQSILEDVKLGFENEEIRTGDFFVKLFDEKKTEIASEAMIEKYSLSPNWQQKLNIYIKPKEENVPKDLNDTILRYKSFYVEDRIREFTRLLSDAEISGEARNEHLEKIMLLTQMRAKIYQALNRLI
ncbi:MAG TPA: hypothetical protein VKY36_07230, partial [Moheibacter sp.]|nr:hypothetical protein [Moheibacter sp.]